MIKFIKTSIISVFALAFMSFMVSPVINSSTAFAAPVACSNKNSPLSASSIGLPTFGCGTNTSIIETITKLAFGALAMLSLLFLVIGGLRYALSGGDSNAIATAKKTITYAVLGLVLGISVFIITSFIFGVLV